MDEKNLYDIEEEYHSRGLKKAQRKERKHAQERDRSKYKKTDQNKLTEKKSSAGSEMGKVVSISPEGVMVAGSTSKMLCQLRGALKKEKGRHKNIIAVGDIVRFDPENLSIESIEPRRSFLSRADNLSRRKEQLIAVNVDIVIITCSVVFPEIKPPLVDRYIIAAQKGNMTPIVVINKVDLLDDPTIDSELRAKEKKTMLAMVEALEHIGIQAVTISTKTSEGIEKLKQLMESKMSVLSGQSGVGKSSIINAVTGMALKTGDVVHKTHKGSHTTTTAQLIEVGEGGFCVDTPGIKSFGIWQLDADTLQHYYPEFTPFAPCCRFSGCSHSVEPGCAVIAAVEEGKISHLRFDSYCALMASCKEKHRSR